MVESVSVELQVAVQAAVEKEADTPAGNPEAANDTETGLPELRVAVMPSVTALPGATERVDDAAESEMADGSGAEAAVVNVESGESVRPPDEFVEPTRKWYRVDGVRFERGTE